MGMLDFITSPVASLAGGALSFLGQQGANQQNMENAQAQMAFQKEMSNTSYQRAVEDMKAAGLSPMLAYSQGGASTPSGAMAAPVQNKLGAGVDALQKGMSTNSAVQLQNAQIDQTKSQAVLNTANAGLAQANIKKAEAETVNAISQNPNIVKMLEKLDAEIRNLQTQSRSNTASAARTEQATVAEKPAADFAKNNPKWAEYLNPVSQSIGVILDAFKAAKPSRGITINKVEK